MRPSLHVLALSSLAASLLVLEACEVKQACTPGATQTCACAGGAQGVQVCDERGQAWGVCGGCVVVDASVDRPLTFIDGPPPDRPLPPDQPVPDRCQPQCGERTCGPDGCGGTCAPGCTKGLVCVTGACATELLSFNVATFPGPPFGPSLPNVYHYETGMKGPGGDAHAVTCTATGTTLRVKATDGASSFEIEGTGWSATTCSLNHVADFSEALLKPSVADSWGFLPPVRPNGEGKYLLNFYLDCKVTGSVLVGTFFFQVLYHFNQDGPYATLDKGALRCELETQP